MRQYNVTREINGVQVSVIYYKQNADIHTSVQLSKGYDIFEVNSELILKSVELEDDKVIEAAIEYTKTNYADVLEQKGIAI